MKKSHKQKDRIWSVSLLNKSKKIKLNERKIITLIKKTLIEINDKKLPKNISEIGVTFCNDAEIKKLNLAYRNKNKPTDVLSFSFIEGLKVNSHDTYLGDVIISLDTAKKQANKFKVSLEEELLRLIVHGILHLFGYDHENVSEKKAKEMFDLQDDLVAKYRKSFKISK
jgi:probable rRNA maturation factor